MIKTMSTETLPPVADLVGDVRDVREVLGRIGAAVAAGQHRDLSGVRCAALAGELLGVLSVGWAAAAGLGKRADDTHELRAQGFGSLHSYLMAGVGLSKGHASAVVGQGRALDRYPDVRAAVLSGEIGADAAQAVTEAVDRAVADVEKSARADARAAGEAIMLPLARTLPVSDVVAAGKRLLDALDPESAARKALESFEKARLRCAQVGDQYVIHGNVPIETGVAFVTILERLVDQRYRSGSLREDEQPTGDDAEDTRRGRHARDRLWAEVFDELVRGLLGNPELVGLGTLHGASPHVTIIAEQGALDSGLGGEIVAPATDAPIPVPAKTVERILCSARVTEIVTTGSSPDLSGAALRIARFGRVDDEPADGCGIDPRDELPLVLGPVDLASLAEPAGDGLPSPLALLTRQHHVFCHGRDYRTAPLTLRRALEARDRHCRFPGCRVDPSRCEAHHVLEWELGGPTCLSNMVLLCRAHHLLVHEGGWRIVLDDGHDAGHPDHVRFDPPERGRGSRYAGTAAFARPPDRSGP
jgi:hypothetical protein